MPQLPRKRNKFSARLYLLIGFVIVLALSVSVGREWYRNYLIRKEIHGLETEAKQLDARRLELLDLSSRFESGEFIEREARLGLGLQKPGESVVVVQNSETQNTQDSEVREKSNPRLWLDYFVYREIR